MRPPRLSGGLLLRHTADGGLRRDAAGIFLGVECGNSAYRTLLDDYLRHLAIGIHNIRLALDCDVVLGGFMAKFLEPYLLQLRDQLAQLDPFDAAGAYLHLSRYPKHAALIGAALYFVKQFLDQV